MAKTKISDEEVELARKRLADPYWRINNLYHIVDKKGSKVLFKLNWAQQQLYEDMWYCNVILKARQLGISTFVCMLFLDRCIFNPNMSAGIIAHTMDDAQAMFRRVKFAYDSLPPHLRALITADNDTAQMLKFSNGSSLRVGTSLRGSTFQYLHISEFGKICSKYPDKAREIISGSLNTVEAGQYIFIESTAEGREGPFFDICKKAQDNQQQKVKLSKLDFRFHFFPWWGQPDYRIGSAAQINKELIDYFISLKGKGIDLDYEQKAWYAIKESTQSEDMKREFPSTPSECWEVVNSGTYYSKQITQCRLEKRICHVPHDEELMVNTAWDLGYNDSNAIWFFQVFGKEIRLIDYLEGSGESLAYWLSQIKKKPYVYDKHLAPHDIKAHEYSSGMTRQASARKMGISLVAVPKVEVQVGIDSCRTLLPRCWFDEESCEDGIKALDNYKKQWNDKTGCWNSSALHNWASHGADAFRTLANGLGILTNRKSTEQIEREKMEALKDSSGRYPGSMFYTPSGKNPPKKSIF